MLVGIVRDRRIGDGAKISHVNMSDGGRLYPRDVMLIPEEMVTSAPTTMDISDLRKMMPTFNINNKKTRNILMIRSGGFGDLLALSSITEYLKEYNIYFYTQKAKFGEAINWHTNRNVKVFEHTTPLFRNFRKQDSLTRLQTWGYIDLGGVVEGGANRNWYEVFFEQIGVSFMPPMGRPSLRHIDNNLYYNKTKKESTCLLCPKASASMRTINLLDIIMATNHIKYKRQVHRYDISDSDVYICKSNNVDILDLCDHRTMFLNLYFADLVITTDSAPIHFREGVCKPALGIYTSFTSECRTKWYKFTKSVDVKANCDLQPCFLHESQKIHYCSKNTNKLPYSPCLSGSFFVEQLRSEVDKYISSIC